MGAEPPPEITKLRIVREPSICIAPQYVAEELLRAEGFVDVEYVQTLSEPYKAPNTGSAMGRGRREGRPRGRRSCGHSHGHGGTACGPVDAGEPIRILTGIHAGCFDLFGADRVCSIKDLKGKPVGVTALGSSHYLYVASIAAYVGLDPQRDIRFVTPPVAESARMLAEGKVDAVIGFPPVSREPRASGMGHVVVDSRVDKPWSQYVCCMFTANHECVRRNARCASLSCVIPRCSCSSLPEWQRDYNEVTVGIRAAWRSPRTAEARSSTLKRSEFCVQVTAYHTQTRVARSWVQRRTIVGIVASRGGSSRRQP